MHIAIVPLLLMFSLVAIVRVDSFLVSMASEIIELLNFNCNVAVIIINSIISIDLFINALNI